MPLVAGAVRARMFVVARQCWRLAFSMALHAAERGPITEAITQPGGIDRPEMDTLIC